MSIPFVFLTCYLQNVNIMLRVLLRVLQVRFRK